MRALAATQDAAREVAKLFHDEAILSRRSSNDMKTSMMTASSGKSIGTQTQNLALCSQ